MNQRDQRIYEMVRREIREEQRRPMMDDAPPRRLSDDELGGRQALEAAGLEPVDGWDDDRDHAEASLTAITRMHAGMHGTPEQVRMRELARRPRRPPITPRVAEALAALADIVRPRARARSSLYGLPKHQADQVRRAIQFIDDLQLHFRRHR